MTSELHPGNASGEQREVEQVQLCRLLFEMGPRVRISLPPSVESATNRFRGSISRAVVALWLLI
jgi:hypothetical protein